VSSKKERDKTQQAIIDLRRSRNWTQRELAAHMGHDIATVGRWEAIRPPRGMSLVELAHVARDFGQFHLAEIFEEALNRDSLLVGIQAGDSSTYLQIAIDHLYSAAHTPSPDPQVYRAYRRAQDAIVTGYRRLVEAIAKGKMPDQDSRLADYRKWQIELEEMQDEEERRRARK
jgi:transcriptional regulator with XRE-family HTH domain